VIGYIDAFNIPYLIVNGTAEKADVIQIVNHDLKGGRLVADHIYQSGHRKIFVIAGPQEHRSHKLRLTGFCERIKELGGEVLKKDIYYSPTSTFEDGYKVGRDLVNGEKFGFNNDFTCYFVVIPTRASLG
jgi:DNA-binding LacI/PurR family transcriptional regulator